MRKNGPNNEKIKFGKYTVWIFYNKKGKQTKQSLMLFVIRFTEQYQFQLFYLFCFNFLVPK